ncbi:hypothetical protein [Mesobacillus jeotgali]|uniref:hypothetical protein n=1 Tax=Mesobacillus jeotgali TaxID=129985 RepID=UPI001CFD919E|nr:hypothetical protein [Mesobacillus jeotgali]
MSEHQPTSDRFREKGRKAVRTSINFGQVWRRSHESCQNINQLRTGLEEKPEKLSEHQPTLDRFGGEARKVVRTSTNLGQVWRRSQASCQNIDQLGTGLEEKPGKLSEHRPTSDRFGGRARKAVRTSINFRQVWRDSNICFLIGETSF